ncbi:MAG: thioredoxin [Armatimonadetes bacterium]|nr:thioredoxin [Armatimonadota bacterium]
MAIELALSTADFETEVLQSNVPVLLDFWAEWCGPCRMIAPHVEALASEYAGKAKIFKIDVDAEGDLAMRYGVMSIPTLMVFKEGKLFDQMVGAASKEQIKAVLDRALA